MNDDENKYAFINAVSESIIGASPDGILVVNHLNQVVTVNLKFFEVWDIPCPDNDPKITVNCSDTPILDNAVARVLDPHGFLLRVRQLYANPDLQDNCEIKLIDGRILERHSCSLKDCNGYYLGRVWFFRDISSHIKLQDELRELACIDPLTGTLNRREFFKRAEDEFMRAKRYLNTFSVIMLDLDFFKKINDTWGHEQGDKILKAASDAWRSALRGQDILGRVGGEEFAVLLPNTNLESALKTAERLNKALQDNKLCHQTNELNCTVSVGVAQVQDTDNSFECSLRRADRALYKAKADGRNCIRTEID